VLVVIGLLVGRIGREASHADAPPAPAGEAQATASARLANTNAAVAAATPRTRLRPDAWCRTGQWLARWGVGRP